MNRLFGIAIVLLLFLSSLSCALMDVIPNPTTAPAPTYTPYPTYTPPPTFTAVPAITPEPTTTPEPNPTDTSVPTPEPDRGTITIINDSEYIIAELYISSVDSPTWGNNRLDSNIIIKPGSSYDATNLDIDFYDMQAVDPEGNQVETVYNVNLEGGASWTVYGQTELPTNAVLRFEDDFSDNKNSWGLTPENDDVKYMPPANGEYCIQIKITDLTAWEWYEPFRTDEFIASVSCYPDPVADASCGLGFGPDGDNLYWFEISPFEQSYALFLLKDDDWQDSLIPWTTSKNINPDGINYLGLQRVNGVVSVFINGVMSGEAQSELFPTGRIGLGGATYDEGNVTVCLDDLRVWQIE